MPAPGAGRERFCAECPAIESLLLATALAVGISPELLPAIVSVTLSRGTRAPATRSTPSRLLLGSSAAVAALALALPFVPPLAGLFGVVVSPLPVLAAVLAIVAGHALLTEWAKQRFWARH